MLSTPVNNTSGRKEPYNAVLYLLPNWFSITIFGIIGVEKYWETWVRVKSLEIRWKPSWKGFVPEDTFRSVSKISEYSILGRFNEELFEFIADIGKVEKDE